MMACDTVSPYPYYAKAALRSLPLVSHSIGLVAVLSKDFFQSIFVLGVVKLDCGGIKPFCDDHDGFDET